MLTSIGNRLTPSAPVEITYGAQPTALGRKFATIFAHRAATGGLGMDYEVLEVINVGDPVAAQAEVEEFAGVGSQAVEMALAFINANALVGRSNYPAFRIVLLPNAETSFGPADEALQATKALRTDLFVSPYPADETVQFEKLRDWANFLSGPDRDLNGQFGSFVQLGFDGTIAEAVALNLNTRTTLVGHLQDTNDAAVAGQTGTTEDGSNVITAIADTSEIYRGATITGAGIPANTVVDKVQNGQIVISANATADASGVALTIQNVKSNTVPEIAAAHAAAMLQSAFPYNPLASVEIGGLQAPRKAEDVIVRDPFGASEQLLQAGISPLTVLPGNTVGFIRTVTTFRTLPGNIAVTAYFDWQQIVTLYDFREICYQVTQLPPFNNNPGGTKASAEKAARLKDEILAEAFIFEELEAFQNVKALAPFFQVEVRTDVRGRFDFKIPVDVIPGLHVIAGNIQAVSDLGEFNL